MVAFTQAPLSPAWGLNHTPEIDMDDTTAALATEELIRELDEAMEAYGRSIDRGLALAAEMRQLADTIDAGLGDSRAELMEWF